MALDYEKTHRQFGKDCRRILFAKLVELYAKFSKEFGDRKAAEIEEILREHPYPDELFLQKTRNSHIQPSSKPQGNY